MFLDSSSTSESFFVFNLLLFQVFLFDFWVMQVQFYKDSKPYSSYKIDRIRQMLGEHKALDKLGIILNYLKKSISSTIFSQYFYSHVIVTNNLLLIKL